MDQQALYGDPLRLHPHHPHHLHREECLEAEIRRLRQAMKILADTVLAGDSAAALVEAEACQRLLEDR